MVSVFGESVAIEITNSLSETQSPCKDLPPVQHVEPNSSVTVPCPVFSASEMVFKLYKGLEAIFSISINQTFRSQINKNPKIDFSANFKFNDTDNSTSFILEAVTMNTTGLYTCEAEKIFPPPFQIVVHKPQTIVLVEGRQVKPHPVCQDVDHLVFWVMFGIMTIYGVVMSLIVAIQWGVCYSCNSPSLSIITPPSVLTLLKNCLPTLLAHQSYSALSTDYSFTRTGILSQTRAQMRAMGAQTILARIAF
ncbi:T-cell-specific surface glycoprotein CD28 [Labeo rohita]|uniref:T-cell-specific surface glycoprotein CD28 n=1 Tax=Labeo rohita TaxID=84645 RepID=A0ABQ8N1C8_LABRO|nr:T-cell-specific surface glycoprotein CD28 [Labeo rohita]